MDTASFSFNRMCSVWQRAFVVLLPFFFLSFKKHHSPKAAAQGQQSGVLVLQCERCLLHLTATHLFVKVISRYKSQWWKIMGTDLNKIKGEVNFHFPPLVTAVKVILLSLCPHHHSHTSFSLTKCSIVTLLQKEPFCHGFGRETARAGAEHAVVWKTYNYWHVWY